MMQLRTLIIAVPSSVAIWMALVFLTWKLL